MKAADKDNHKFASKRHRKRYAEDTDDCMQSRKRLAAPSLSPRSENKVISPTSTKPSASSEVTASTEEAKQEVVSLEKSKKGKYQ